jgi:sulfite reductase (NADPH) hemoprotein beta-component
VPLDDLMSYAEACLRVYNRYGRRDNIYKARIKILIHELGADEYRRQVEEEYAHVLARDRPALRRARPHRRFFADAEFRAFDAGAPDAIDRSDPDFAVWVDQNRRAQGARLRDRQHQPETRRRHSRRCHGRRST